MSYNPDKHHRRSIRLKGYDYTRTGGYYITICTWDRGWLFGEIKNGVMVLNQFGEIVLHEWMQTSSVRPNITLDAFTVMPNHMHGIIIINNNNANESMGGVNGPGANNRSRAPEPVAPTEKYAPSYGPCGFIEPPSKMPNGPKSGSIGAIMAQFKSVAVKQINFSRATPSAPVWERGFYERIIRDNNEFDRIRQYIMNNPLSWKKDIENHLSGIKNPIPKEDY